MTITSVSTGYRGGSGDTAPEPGASRGTVLLIEDSAAQAAAYQAYLTEAGYLVEHVATGEQALTELTEHAPDVVILDLFLPGIQGVEVLRSMRERGDKQPVIVITDHASVDTAVGAMKDGAYDFVTKPFGADRIRITVENALHQQDLKNKVRSYRENYERDSFHGFIGASKAMQSVYRIIESAATSRATIFITGESGTGKELCAHAVHAESPRADMPFVAINCAAIPSSLMESEIFGYKKGAFTGADSDRGGAAVQADGGTLFLDEICEMDLDLQAKLLRFVQTGAFRPVGGNDERSVDVRFICATNKDPLEEVKRGRFREDLYYRLHVVPIALPSLRDRTEDIIPIGDGLLRLISAEEGKSFERFSPGAQDLLLTYSWPGNVRQFENILRSVVVLHDADEVTTDMMPAPVNRTAAAVVGTSAPAEESTIRSLREVERESIEAAIEACGGNIPKAAALLGVSPSTLYRKRQTWDDD
ncbi:MAG: sigma-54-dependent transcriptional regulator [Gammaproteobacteria bacterium]